MKSQNFIQNGYHYHVVDHTFTVDYCHNALKYCCLLACILNGPVKEIHFENSNLILFTGEIKLLDRSKLMNLKSKTNRFEVFLLIIVTQDHF